MRSSNTLLLEIGDLFVKESIGSKGETGRVQYLLLRRKDPSGYDHKWIMRGFGVGGPPDSTN